MAKAVPGRTHFTTTSCRRPALVTSVWTRLEARLGKLWSRAGRLLGPRLRSSAACPRAPSGRAARRRGAGPRGRGGAALRPTHQSWSGQRSDQLGPTRPWPSVGQGHGCCATLEPADVPRPAGGADQPGQTQHGGARVDTDGRAAEAGGLATAAPGPQPTSTTRSSLESLALVATALGGRPAPEGHGDDGDRPGGGPWLIRDAPSYLSNLVTR